MNGHGRAGIAQLVRIEILKMQLEDAEALLERSERDMEELRPGMHHVERGLRGMQARLALRQEGAR